MARPLESLVQQIDAKNAEEFLDYLTPHRGGPLWDRSSDHQCWIFRGQADANWKLVPKAHRDRDEFFHAGLSGANIHPRPGPTPYTPEELLDRESAAAKVFAGRASSLGYEIPWDRVELRNRELAPIGPFGANYPRPQEWGIYALAQHYGVPTRLLDWSFKPLIAAYFAAKGPAEKVFEAARRNEAPLEKHLAVWAVNERFLSTLCYDRDPGVAVVTVPKTTNPNLARQEGLFTLVRFKEAPSLLVNPPPLDDLIADPDLVRLVRDTEGFPLLPMLYKFTLPYDEARFLLYYLVLNGIDASHIFEGHGSIVDGMGEDRFRSVCSRADRVNWKRCEPPGH